MSDAPITEIELTHVFTTRAPGRVNIRAGGIYALLIEVKLSPEAHEYLLELATPLLAAAERITYGATDLEMYGLAVANRLRLADDPRAQEILEALQGHNPKTWFTRIPKP